MGQIGHDNQNANDYLQAVSVGALSTATELPSGGLGATCVAKPSKLTVQGTGSPREYQAIACCGS